MNRQPTLVRTMVGLGCTHTHTNHRQKESMLGMRILIGPNFSFGASCGPIEALRGDYNFADHCVTNNDREMVDGDEINLHLPQGSHVVSRLVIIRMHDGDKLGVE